MVAFNPDFKSAAQLRSEFLEEHRTRLLREHPALADIESDEGEPLRFIFDRNVIAQDYGVRKSDITGIEKGDTSDDIVFIDESEPVAALVDDLLEYLPHTEKFEIIPV